MRLNYLTMPFWQVERLYPGDNLAEHVVRMLILNSPRLGSSRWSAGIVNLYAPRLIDFFWRPLQLIGIVFPNTKLLLSPCLSRIQTLFGVSSSTPRSSQWASLLVQARRLFLYNLPLVFLQNRASESGFGNGAELPDPTC
jgi:hypothetical protein